MIASSQSQQAPDLLFKLALLATGLLVPLLLPVAPALPAVLYLLVALLLLAAAVLVPMRSALNLAALFAAGALWTLAAMAQATSERIPERLDKCRWQVQGEIAGLPRSDSRRTSFELEVKSGHWVSCPRRQNLRPEHWQVSGKRLRLSLYRNSRGDSDVAATPAPALTAGASIDALVQLRSPSGLANPAVSSSESYFLRAGLAATGYVRELTQVSPDAKGLDYRRWQLGNWLGALPGLNESRWLKALLIGDQRELSTADWTLLRQTGTVHLMVVSGLHISLAAGFGWLFGWLLAVVSGGRRHHFGMLFAMLAAGSYALVTGLGIPAQRALIMVAIFAGTSLLHRQIPLSHRYLYTFIAVVISAPLAPLGPGFWLSFMAVLILLLLIPGASSSRVNLRLWLIGLIKAQAALTMMLVPLLMQLQGQIHLISPLVNLLAVPLLSFALLPSLLIAAPLDGLLALFGSNSAVFLHVPDALVGALQGGLTFAANLDASWQLRSGWALLAPIIVPLIWLPLPNMLRAAALLLWLLLILVPQPAKSTDFRLVMLDVGQGLSAFVQTGDSAVVYDTGPAYASGNDSARRVLIPVLRHYGVRHITTLVVSHGDYDHAGGTASLATAMPPARVIAGQPERLPSSVHAEPCAPDSWREADVSFTITQAPIDRDDANAHSCVMIVRVGGQVILFPGDLPARGELSLLPELGGAQVDVLIASHHGSRDASHPRFLQAIKPKHVLYATGYHNSYGHPAPAACANARSAGARLYNTAHQGAVEISLNDAGKLAVTKLHRCTPRRWWQRRHPLACELDLGYLGNCPDDV